MRLLKSLHRRLLPDDPRVGWLPYLWLVYLSFFFWRYLYVRPGTFEVLVGIISLALFWSEPLELDIGPDWD